MTAIGIDTGGTCTDAVIYDLDTKRILCTAKSATTHGRLEIGIRNSLRKLPGELVDKASYISLSTTLATNACVENKGGKVCLIFIGVEKRNVEMTWKKYGFDGMDFMRFLPGDVKKGTEPDWKAFEKMLPGIYAEFDGIAISQMNARENGEPVIDPDGVSVGGWQTFVQGIEIDTIALGGDSRVCCRSAQLYLEDRRVRPLSELVKEYPYVLDELERLVALPQKSDLPLFEHFVMMRDIAGREEHYSKEDIRICDILRKGPKSIACLAEALGKDPYMLRTSRLEDEAVILRCGLTPTDAMVLKGDRVPDETGVPWEKTPEYQAALCAVRYIEKNTGLKAQELPERIYSLVKEKLYCNLVRILWKDSLKDTWKLSEQDVIMKMAKEAFERESSHNQKGFYHPAFETDAVLLGGPQFMCF